MSTTKHNVQKKFMIVCPYCKRNIINERNDSPFIVEILQQEKKESYDKETRCPRCHTWLGIYN